MEDAAVITMCLPGEPAALTLSSQMEKHRAEEHIRDFCGSSLELTHLPSGQVSLAET